MTGDFAIVAEGITDQVVIKNILLAWFADGEEPFVNFVQPQLDETSRSTLKESGGWTLVQRYFEERRFIGALQLNKYLVVHIDSDIAADMGIALVVAGVQRTPEEIVEALIGWFETRVSDEVWKEHGRRFLFAIAVESIECWLLPLVFDRSQKAKLKKTSGCLKAIDHERRTQNKAPLSSADAKNPAVYRDIAEGFGGRADLEAKAALNVGFKRFVEQLAAVTLPPQSA